MARIEFSIGFLILFVSCTSVLDAGKSYFMANQTKIDTERVAEPSPRTAMYASLVYPGLGQFYLHKWLKGIALASFQTYNIYQYNFYNRLNKYVMKTRQSVIDTSSVDYWNKLEEARKKELIRLNTGYNLKIDSWRPRAKRDKYGWWILATSIYAMLDAYVDAHLYNFEDKMDISFFIDERLKVSGAVVYIKF